MDRERSVRYLYIHEAVKKALEDNKCIQRKGEERVKFLPTNSIGCVYVIALKGWREGKRKPRWNPSADDLMSDEWEVVT